MVKVQVNKQEIPIVIDTEASLTIISEETLNISFGGLDLKPTNVSLRMYTGEPLLVIGMLDVEVTYGPQQATLPIIVVQGKGPSLFGRNWMEVIRLNWSNINHVTTKLFLDRIISICPVHFSDWASPIVPGVKNDGTIGICGDYEVTANLVAKQDSYLMPHVEDLFAKVSGDRIFEEIYYY